MDGENGAVAVSVDAVMDRLRAKASGFGARECVGFVEMESETDQAAAPPRKDRVGPAAVNGHTRPQADPGGNTGPPPDLSVVGRLRRRFGLGDDPKRRMLLYQRLDRLVQLHGELVLQLISEAAAGAVGKEKEGRWFARAICAKLAEHKVGMKGKVGDGSW